MKKIFLFSLLLLFTSMNIFAQGTLGDLIAQEDEDAEESAAEVPYSPFVIYKANYLIFGNRDDQVKAHLSFKYEVLKESGLYLAYNQMMFWQLYDKSSPFSEINFNPEAFWNFGDNIDFLRLGFYEHKSNGKDGLASRGWDRSYVQFQVSTGEFFNVGIDVKGFYIWSKAKENKDIDDYAGYGEAKLFFRFLKSGPDSMTDKEEIYVRGGTGKANYGFDYKKGWVEGGMKIRMLFKSIQPHFYVQGFYGYGESLIGYNQKDMAIRAGFILE